MLGQQRMLTFLRKLKKSYDEVKAVLKEIVQLLQARGMIDEFVIKE